MHFTTVWLFKTSPSGNSIFVARPGMQPFSAVVCFWPKLCSLQACSTLCAIPYPAFQCCCSEMSIFCSSQNSIQKFECSLVWRMLYWILPNSGKMIYWSTDTIFTCNVNHFCIEYQFILVRSECVNSVGRCRTEAGCRDHVQLEGWSVHLLIYIRASISASLLLPVLSIDCKPFSLPCKESDVGDVVLL